MLRNGNLTQLVQELERQKRNSMDIVVRSDVIEAKAGPPANGLVLAVDAGRDVAYQEFPLTPYAHNQLAEKMGIPQRYYDRMLQTGNTELLADNINAWMNGKERRLLRILDGNVRAILSDRYRPIDNYDLTFALLDQLKKGAAQGVQAEIFACDVSETRMYIKMKLPTMAEVIHNDRVQAMIMLTNSEVGAGRMAVALGMWRLVCLNGMWAEDIVQRVHLGSKLEEGLVEWSEGTIRKTDEALFAQVQDTIATAFEPQLWDGFVRKAGEAAQAKLEGNIVEIIDAVAPKYDITGDEKAKLLEMFAQEIATPAGKTQWGLANAVTRLARDTEQADRQVELEVIGGEIMQGKALQPLLVQPVA